MFYTDTILYTGIKIIMLPKWARLIQINTNLYKVKPLKRLAAWLSLSPFDHTTSYC